MLSHVQCDYCVVVMSLLRDSPMPPPPNTTPGAKPPGPRRLHGAALRCAGRERGRGGAAVAFRAGPRHQRWASGPRPLRCTDSSVLRATRAAPCQEVSGGLSKLCVFQDTTQFYFLILLFLFIYIYYLFIFYIIFSLISENCMPCFVDDSHHSSV